MPETNIKINGITLGKGAGEKLHKDSTYCIIIGPTGPRNSNNPEHYRLWIDIIETDKPLIGADFKNDIVTINGNLSVTGDATLNNVTITGTTTIEGDVEATLNHSALSKLGYTESGHIGFEPTLTKGNLTAGSTKITIGGTGANAVIGSGISIDVNEANINHNSLLNTHNLTTDIDHNSITNTHNLTTDIDHDALTNFSGNEHIDHTTVSISAGTGMSGGGTIDANRTLNCDITQYTDALARQAISETITGIDYNNSTGIFSMTAGYGIPTTTQISNADNAILKDGTVQFTANYNIGSYSLGINTSTPRRKLDILDSANPQLRLSQADNSKYNEFKVDSSGIFYGYDTNGYKFIEIQGENTGKNTRIGGFTNYYGGAGTGNTAYGYGTLAYNTGSDNVVIGSGAGYALTGIRNVVIGSGAGIGLTGNLNILVGYNTGSAMANSGSNIIIGNSVARGMVDVNNNIILGYGSGNALTGGNHNTYLGNYTDFIQPDGTMTATLQAGGSLDTGYHFYTVSFIVDGVETAMSKGYALGAPFVLATAGNQTAYLQVIPTYTGPGTCTARKIYRTKKYPGNSLYSFYYVGTISDNVTTTYTDTIADASLGAIYSANPSSCVLLGSYSKALSGNTFVAGSETAPINKVYFGEGVYSTTPSDTTVYATGGFGTNIAGANLILQGGIATGNAVGGYIDFKTSDAGASGIAGQASTSKFRIDPNGIGFFGVTPVGQRLKVSYNNWASFTDVVDALVDLGLFDQA